MSDITYTLSLDSSRVIGFNEDLVLGKLIELLNDKATPVVLIGDKKYLRGSYAELREKYFPFWGEVTVMRTLISLEKMKLVDSIQPEGFGNRRKYYTTNT